MRISLLWYTLTGIAIVWKKIEFFVDFLTKLKYNYIIKYVQGAYLCYAILYQGFFCMALSSAIIL